jgi:hypothetical protein
MQSRRFLIVVLLAAVGACSGSPASRAAPTTAIETTSTSRAPVSPRLTAWSRRTFRIRVILESRAAVAIGLHPNAEPIRVGLLPPRPAELCGASVADGTVDERKSCVAFDAAGRASVPPTNGGTHIAFAVRLRSDRAVRVDLTVTYAAEDPFVLVVPPTARFSGTAVDFIPRTVTAGANAYLLPGYRPAPTVAVTMKQAGRGIHDPRPCDFPAEIDCLGRVGANRQTEISMAGRDTGGGRPALYIVWQ